MMLRLDDVPPRFRQGGTIWTRAHVMAGLDPAHLVSTLQTQAHGWMGQARPWRHREGRVALSGLRLAAAVLRLDRTGHM